MTDAQEQAIEEAKLMAGELAGMLGCLQAYAVDRASSIGAPISDAIAGCERMARAIDDKLDF